MNTSESKVFLEQKLDLTCVASPEGYFLQLNPAWADTLGYSLDELKSKPFIELVHPKDREKTAEKAKQLFENNDSGTWFENRYLHKDGSYVWLQWSATLFDNKVYGIARDITEIKKQTRYFEEIQEAAKIGYWRFNIKTSELTWSRETYIIHGLSPDDPTPPVDKALDFYPNEARATVSRALELGVNKGTPWDLELPFVRVTGELIWVRAIGKPVKYDGEVTEIYGIFQDITAKKNKDTQLAYLFEESGDGFWDWYIQDDYEYMSPRFWEILGHDPATKKHHPDEWLGLMFEEDRPVAFENFEKHVATKGQHPYRQEVRYRHKDGSTVWVVCQGKVVEWDAEGKPVRMIGSHTDVTSLKQAQIKLLESSKLASLGEMAGGIAHEINNPLAIIASSTTTLKAMIRKNKFDTDKFTKYVDRIDDTVSRLSNIIEGMKSLLRNETKNMETCNLNKIISASYLISSERMKTNRIDGGLEISDDIDILCNKTQLSQVLINLINNSIDAVKNTENPWIRVETQIHDKRIQIRVIDSGPPIPEKIKLRLFEPFYTSKPPGEGTGLGLSISREIMIQHKGNLYFDEKAQNNTFVLEFST